MQPGKDDFPHRDHLALAVWYSRDSNPTAALNSMRASLHRFLEHHGCLANYHETMTVFWIKLVHETLSSLGAAGSLLEQTNAVVERLSDSRIVYEYYSKEMVESEAARRGWVEPDLKTLTEGS